MAGGDDLIPENVEEYRKKEYWDWRYEQCNDDTYEWFKGYDYFKDSIRPHMNESDRILMLGCGNSSNKGYILYYQYLTSDLSQKLGFSEEMCQDGFKDILNVDYSEKVIEMMKERTRDTFPTLKWMPMDFRNMSELEGSSFDLVLDKGSLDALWSDGGSQWDPSESVLSDINASLNEVLRLLRSKGKFISITFGQPHFRLPHMKRPDEWEIISNEKLGLYYIYVFQKN